LLKLLVSIQNGIDTANDAVFDAAKRLKVWYYERRMNVAYAHATWCRDYGMEAASNKEFVEGDRYRWKWLKAQGITRHPSFSPINRHADWVNDIHDGGFEDLWQ
jgi:hypothetical protein